MFKHLNTGTCTHICVYMNRYTHTSYIQVYFLLILRWLQQIKIYIKKERIQETSKGESWNERQVAHLREEPVKFGTEPTRNQNSSQIKN